MYTNILCGSKDFFFFHYNFHTIIFSGGTQLKIHKGQIFICSLSISTLWVCYDLKISESFYKRYSRQLLRLQCKNLKLLFDFLRKYLCLPIHWLEITTKAELSQFTKGDYSHFFWLWWSGISPVVSICLLLYLNLCLHSLPNGAFRAELEEQTSISYSKAEHHKPAPLQRKEKVKHPWPHFNKKLDDIIEHHYIYISIYLLRELIYWFTFAGRRVYTKWNLLPALLAVLCQDLDKGFYLRF